MFDLGWSKLLILAIIAIVVVGPKELPALLRTVGKLISHLRRQAEEFRAQFSEAIRDTEIEQIRRDVEDIKRTATESVTDIGRQLDAEMKPLEETARAMEQSISVRDEDAWKDPGAVASVAEPARAPEVSAVEPAPPLPGPEPAPAALPDPATANGASGNGADHGGPVAAPASPVVVSEPEPAASEPAPLPHKTGAAAP